jgi:hypothetical protein
MFKNAEHFFQSLINTNTIDEAKLFMFVHFQQLNLLERMYVNHLVNCYWKEANHHVAMLWAPEMSEGDVIKINTRIQHVNNLMVFNNMAKKL